MKEQVTKEEHKNTTWTICESCKGRGRKTRRIRKKTHLKYQSELELFEKTQSNGTPPTKPKAELTPCINCSSTGLTPSKNAPLPDYDNYPHLAIIGGGIGGVALAVACLHRGIPFTLYERDSGFNARSQGYGLTLQQASKAIEGLGITELDEGIISTIHLVHTTDGKIIGEWGLRKRTDSSDKKPQKRRNIHIARQSLRFALLNQLKGHASVKWNHQLTGFTENNQKGVTLNFIANGELKNTTANLIVGADGIRSTVRKLIIGEQKTPLRYLGCIVILGICPLKNLNGFKNELLDSATVFQTANATERLYMMPYSSDSIMWQLSFQMTEEDAKQLSKQGPKALKEESCKRTKWHDPVPQILAATNEAQISGYPVYDRILLQPQLLHKNQQATILGDAAHPMSPFKGQGANQALLDALSLARSIYKNCGPLTDWKKEGIRKSVLNEFELEMISRSTSKVNGSAEAAKFLHSETILQEGNETRGRDTDK